MATDTAQERTDDGNIDQARIQEFSGRLLEVFTLGVVGLIIDLADRIGLLEVLDDLFQGISGHTRSRSA
jgi:hypothetical protein